MRSTPHREPPGSSAAVPDRPGRTIDPDRTTRNAYARVDAAGGLQWGAGTPQVLVGALDRGRTVSLTAIMPPRLAMSRDPQLRPVISFHGVSKTYSSGTVAVRDVDLAIYQGDFCFLVGASGAGKSTLVRLLIRDEPASTGRIFVDGQEVTRMPRRRLPRLRRKFGIVFQDFKLLPKLTVAQNVAFALQVTRPGQRHLKEKVEETLWIVGLEDKLTKFPDELSGGEQQRVAIARALVHRPKIFLADEPTGNLDPDTSWGIVQLLLQINHRGTTVLMATHNREVVDLVRRRVIAIEGGRVIRDEAEGQYLKEGNATI
jgi:cell division transport system ATP-binding protein